MSMAQSGLVSAPNAAVGESFNIGAQTLGTIPLGRTAGVEGPK